MKNKMLASALLGSMALGGCSGSGGGDSTTTPVVTYSPSQTVEYFKDKGFTLVSGANPTCWEITGNTPSNQQITYLQNQNSNDCSTLTSHKDISKVQVCNDNSKLNQSEFSDMSNATSSNLTTNDLQKGQNNLNIVEIINGKIIETDLKQIFNQFANKTYGSNVSAPLVAYFSTLNPLTNNDTNAHTGKFLKKDEVAYANVRELFDKGTYLNLLGETGNDFTGSYSDLNTREDLNKKANNLTQILTNTGTLSPGNVFFNYGTDLKATLPTKEINSNRKSFGINEITNSLQRFDLGNNVPPGSYVLTAKDLQGNEINVGLAVVLDEKQSCEQDVTKEYNPSFTPSCISR